MGETGLFSIAQVRVRHTLDREYSLFGSNSLSSLGYAHDEGVDGTVSPLRDGAWTVREKAKLAEEELFELRN